MYDNLASLRAALTSDNVDRRTEAYEAVLSENIRPNDVLDDEPPVEDLQEAEIIPGPDEGDSRADREDRIIELLEEIAANTGGDSA